MFKIHKKLVLATTLVLSLTLIIIGGIKASANNDIETNHGKKINYSFNFNNNNTETTNVIEKETASKAYIKCNNSSHGFFVKIYGTNIQNADIENSTDCSTAQCSEGNGLYITTGTAKYISNSVKQNGYNYTFLKANSFNNYLHNPSNGVWSPDAFTLR